MFKVIAMGVLELVLVLLLAVLKPEEEQPPRLLPHVPAAACTQLSLGFKLSPTETRLAELQRRLAISQVFWRIGDCFEEQKYRNQAVGVLDSSIPIPRAEPKQQRCGESYSPYGSLDRLVTNLLLDRPDLAARLTPEQTQRLLELARHRGTGRLYLRLLHSEYEELVPLLQLLTAHPKDLPDAK